MARCCTQMYIIVASRVPGGALITVFELGDGPTTAVTRSPRDNGAEYQLVFIFTRP